MRNILMLCILLSVGVMGFSQGKDDEAKAKKTFKYLVKSIRAADYDVYYELWDYDRVESEGMASKLESGEEKWAELQGIFKGPQKLTNIKFYTEDGRQFLSADVKAKKADQGGIGSIRMLKIEDYWVMYNW